VLATVARITVAIEVAIGSIASISATTSSRRCDRSVAGNRSISEVSRVSGGEGVAVEGSNEGVVVLGVSNIGTSELIVEDTLTVSELIALKGILGEIQSVLSEV